MLYMYQFKVWNINNILLQDDAQKICINHGTSVRYMETENKIIRTL